MISERDMPVRFSGGASAVTPYRAASAGAETFFKGIISGFDSKDIRIPAPLYEISAPAAVKYGISPGNGALKRFLDGNTPVFSGIEIFNGAFSINGHINLSVSDGFYEYFAGAIAQALPVGSLCERIELPDSPRYAHARLLMCASRPDNGGFRPSAAERRALWMCFALLEDGVPDIKRSRSKAAAVRAVMAMLSPERSALPAAPPCGTSAAAMAAIINRFIINQ